MLTEPLASGSFLNTATCIALLPGAALAVAYGSFARRVGRRCGVSTTTAMVLGPVTGTPACGTSSVATPTTGGASDGAARAAAAAPNDSGDRVLARVNARCPSGRSVTVLCPASRWDAETVGAVGVVLRIILGGGGMCEWGIDGKR
jgi:hypothetical protein